MQFNVKNSFVSFSSHSDSFSEAITFQVMPEGRNKISIADNYVFGNQYPSEVREQVSGRFVIERLNNSHADSYSSNKNRIGKVLFYEASIDEFASYSIPSLIYFRVFLKEKQFDEIKQAMLHGLPVANLGCGLDGLEFGWEPDGFHLEWKLKEGEEITKSRFPLQDALITDFNIGFGKYSDDEYWEGRDEDEEKPVIKKESAIKAWLKENGIYATIVAFIMAYLLFK